MKLRKSSLIFLLMCKAILTHFVMISSQEELEKLPPNGFGILTLVRNNSTEPAAVYYQKGPHDAVPHDSIVRLKSLETGKYYTVKKVTYGEQVKYTEYVCAPDADDPNDEAALFTAQRYLDYELNDWITFAHKAAKNRVMEVDDKGKVVFESEEYEDADFKQRHFTIVPDDESKPLASLCLQNRTNQGNVHPMTKEEEYLLEQSESTQEPYRVVWGTTKAAINLDPNVYLTANTLVTFYPLWNDQGRKLYLWTSTADDNHARGTKGDVLFGAGPWWSGSLKGAHMFLVRRANDPGYAGALYYGDPIEIVSVWEDGSNPRLIPPPGKKWWIYTGIDLWGTPNHGTPIAGGNIEGNEIFEFIAVPDEYQATGDVHPVDEVYKGPIKVGDNIAIKSRSLNKRFWVEWSDHWLDDARWRPLVGDWMSPNRSLSGKSIFKLERAPADQYAQQISQAYGLPVRGRPHKWVGNNWNEVQTNYDIVQLSIYKADDIWAVTTDRTLLHGNGSAWNNVGQARYVSVGGDGIAWQVDVENKIRRLDGSSWKPMLAEGNVTFSQVAAKNKSEAWALTTDGDIKVWQDTKWVSVDFEGRKAISISASNYDNTVCVVDKNERIFKWRNEQWNLIPGGLVQVSVQGDDDIWGVNSNRDCWHWNGKTWNQVPGKLAYVATSHGSTEKLLKPEKKAKRTVTTAYTTDKDGNPYPKNSDAKIKIEVVKAGATSGGIPSGSTRPFGLLPISKKPRIAGFARNILTGFDEGMLVSLNPLVNKGIAWLDTSFKDLGKASVSFFARSGDEGDIQIIFGNRLSKDFLWKITIGADGNTKSMIEKFEGYDDEGDLLTTPVCVVDRKQNPLATASPGNFEPYWASFDVGTILVGRGDLGENVFLSYSAQENQEALVPSYVGFGCNRQIIEYTEIKIGDPLIAQSPTRKYIKKPEVYSVNAGAITWKNFAKFPFRIADQGSVSFKLKGKSDAVLGLGTDDKEGSDHYAIIFGADKNQFLKVQKWSSKTKKYIDVYGPVYVSFALDEKKPISLWVSYADGEFIIGRGTLGEEIIMALTDANPHTNIRQIGFGTLGDEGIAVKDIQIAPPVSFGFAAQEETYKRTRTRPKFKGKLNILVPFEDVFNQEGAAITCRDTVSGQTIITQNTPERGTLYFYGVSIDKTGVVQLFEVRNPDNPEKRAILKKIRKKFLDAEKELRSSEFEYKAADFEAQMGELRAQYHQNISDAGLQTASFIRETGTAMVTAGGNIADPLAGKIVVAAGSAIAAGSIIRAGLTELDLKKAAEKRLEGAQAADVQKRKAVDKERSAMEMEFEARWLQGEVEQEFARTSGDVYYVDEPRERELGVQEIPRAAERNRDAVDVILSDLEALKAQLDDPEVFKEFVTRCDRMLLLINHFAVVDGVREQVWENLDLLFEHFKIIADSASIEVVSLRYKVLKILFAAINNVFLVDAESKYQRDTWYNYIKELGFDLFNHAGSQEIKLDKQYGEYLWLPNIFKVKEQGLITFSVKGQDFLLALSPEQERLRNTDKEFYELAFGSSGNKKSVIRLKSLGKPIKEYPLRLNTASFEQYWVNFDRGIISIGKGKPGENRIFEWHDPYPVKGIVTVGISNWNIPVSIKNIKISSVLKLEPMKEEKGLMSRVKSGVKESIDRVGKAVKGVTSRVTGAKKPAPTRSKTSAKPKPKSKVVEEVIEGQKELPEVKVSPKKKTLPKTTTSKSKPKSKVVPPEEIEVIEEEESKPKVQPIKSTKPKSKTPPVSKKKVQPVEEMEGGEIEVE